MHYVHNQRLRVNDRLVNICLCNHKNPNSVRVLDHLEPSVLFSIENIDPSIILTENIIFRKKVKICHHFYKKDKNWVASNRTIIGLSAKDLGKRRHCSIA